MVIGLSDVYFLFVACIKNPTNPKQLIPNIRIKVLIILSAVLFRLDKMDNQATPKIRITTKNIHSFGTFKSLQTPIIRTNIKRNNQAILQDISKEERPYPDWGENFLLKFRYSSLKLK